jgi:hypothetical protein
VELQRVDRADRPLGVVAVKEDWDLIDLCEKSSETLGKEFMAVAIPYLLAMAYVADLRPRDVATSCMFVLGEAMIDNKDWPAIQMAIANMLSERATGEAAA